MAKTDNLDMAEPSGGLVMNAKPRTRKIRKLIPDQALQALEDVIIECQNNGIDLSTSPFFENGVQALVIVLKNVVIDEEQHLYLVASTGNEDKP